MSGLEAEMTDRRICEDRRAAPGAGESARLYRRRDSKMRGRFPELVRSFCIAHANSLDGPYSRAMQHGLRAMYQELRGKG